jgi:membrane protein DedA with SNARE-associated domain
MQHFIVDYGYAAVLVLMLAESACIPIPSEFTMLLGGALAAGAVPGAHLNLVGVIAAGVIGNTLGSYVAWAIGRYGGQTAWRRWGRYVMLRDADIDRAEKWFARNGANAVFFGRLLPVVRTFISLPAGFAAMRPVRFGVYTVAGCIPWTVGLAVAGYEVGANWQQVADAFHGPTYIIAAAVVIVAVFCCVVLVRRSRARRRPGQAGPADGNLEAMDTGSGQRSRSA